MEKVWVDGHWVFSFALRSWQLIPSGYYEPNIYMDNEVKHTIGENEARMLITAMDEGGWIKPRLDERLRVEDLKITHRLLDIIEKTGST